MAKRVDAMLQAAKTVQPALQQFYAALNNEQKARFNTLGQQEAPLLSARNRLRGTVAGIRAGELLAEVTIDLREGAQVIAAVTRASIDRLGLETGGRVSVYVKATELTLGP